MGGRDSSSKRKSSKTKRDKTSSQKRIRKKESKKHRRIHDSVSSYSDDLPSLSKSDCKRIILKNKKPSDSDSSLDDYKHKKARRSRLDLKSSKKGARERSSMPKGDGDALRSGNKRKRSGRDGAAKPKKKSSKKKRQKYSSSYSGSDSESCPTCKSNSSKSTADDSKHRRNEIILDNGRGRPRGRELDNSSKKRKIRSPSCSSIDRGNKHSDVPLMPVNNNNNSRRLRSVVTVVDQRYDEGEENRWEMDPQKEEVFYDPNDYSTPKSLDSNEGRNEMEIDNQSHGVSSKIIGVENVAGEEIIERGKSIIEVNEGDQDNYGDIHPKAVDVNNFEKGKEIDNSVPVTDLGGDVLESILRQKALANLKNFKGRLQTGVTSTNNSKMNHGSNVNMPSDLTVENIQNESTGQGNPNFQEMNQNRGPSQKRNLSQFKEDKILSDSENVEKMNRVGGPSQIRSLSRLKEVEKLSDSENVEKMNLNSGLTQKRNLSQLKEIKKLSDSENIEKMNRNSGPSQRDLSQLTEVKKLSDSENAEKMNRNSGPSQRGLFQLKEVKKLSDSENAEKMNLNSGPTQKRDLSQFKEVKILADSENIEKMNRVGGPSQIKSLSRLKEVKKLPDSENVEKMNLNIGPSQKKDFSQLKEVKKLSDSENIVKMNRISGSSHKRDPSQLKEVKKLSDSENVEKMNRISGPSQKENLSQFTKHSDSENVAKESGIGTQTVEHPTNSSALLECPGEGKYIISDDVLAEPVSRTDTCPGTGTTIAGSSSITEPSSSSSIGPMMTEEHSLERENEAKDGSQYEQKTMSVMRGGEMVQVSYKVYIPKKAAAHARRSLRR